MKHFDFFPIWNLFIKFSQFLYSNNFDNLN